MGKSSNSNTEDAITLKPDELWYPSLPKGYYIPQYKRTKAQIIKDCLMVGEVTELRVMLLDLIWK